MRQMEIFLLANAKNTFFTWFKTLCREGDIYLTSEALARLAEILAFHKNFGVRKCALQLISDFIFWGDL